MRNVYYALYPLPKMGIRAFALFRIGKMRNIITRFCLDALLQPRQICFLRWLLLSFFQLTYFPDHKVIVYIFYELLDNIFFKIVFLKLSSHYESKGNFAFFGAYGYLLEI